LKPGRSLDCAWSIGSHVFFVLTTVTLTSARAQARLARLPGFTKALDNANDFDINSTQGREAQTLHYLSHNVVSVCVENTSPSLFVHEGCLMAGENSDLDITPDITRAGRVITDLRWVTLVEREQLATLIAAPNNLSFEAACERVDAYQTGA